MFHDMLISGSALSFPIVTNVGDMFQVLPDNTRLSLRFSGIGYAPATSRLEVQSSVNGLGPWTDYDYIPFSLNGSQLPLFSYTPAPYDTNNYYRMRWYNPTTGYTGPYMMVAGPTVKGDWNVATVPIAPTAITAIATVAPSPFPSINVTITHSLSNSGNYSNTGIWVQATGIQSGFFVTDHAFFSIGWGASVGASQIYNVPFTSGTTAPFSAATGASAQYFVLGDPLPGILGTIVNY